ncbi:MAG: hydroxyethylthiazole kinase [Candidatus Zixiibacteriota bacterium]
MKDFANNQLGILRENAPLVHNITNFVVMGSTANILLALGASPVMAHSADEVADMASIASALVLNIGTLQASWVDSMLIAAEAANKKGIPVILDPVGAGATRYRTDTVKRILKELKIDVLRGNASEIMAVMQSGVKTKGVESSISLSKDIHEAARDFAKAKQIIVAISGERDFITDGKTDYIVENGHPIMTKVTGLGCGLSSVVGAFCGVSEVNRLKAVASAFGIYGLAGDMAVRKSILPGSFYIAFLDMLASIDEDDIKQGLKIR